MTQEQYIKIALLALIAMLTFLIVRIVTQKHSKIKNSLHQKYLLEIFKLAVILCCVLNILGTLDSSLNIRTLAIRGSALFVAILGFAAQPAISDIICGLLISINKPFEIGDRIIVEGLEPGIVEDITLRHTVLKIYDDIRIVVPNSQLNSKTVTNTSYKNDKRGVHIQYSVSFDTDVQKAMDLIRDSVVESPYTLGTQRNGISEDSGPVYFLKYAESAIILETTIWISKSTSSYTATTDVNMRVNNNFRKNGIEIPYNYLNVLKYNAEKKNTADSRKEAIKEKPSKRNVRTNTVRLKNGNDSVAEALQTASYFARRQNMNAHNAMQLELLCEESIGVVKNIIDSVKTDFWIEGSGLEYRIYLAIKAKVGSEEYQKLIGLSTSGKNEAVNGFSSMLWEAMLTGLNHRINNTQKDDYEWKYSEEVPDQSAIGESILTAIASEIKVKVTKDKVELIVIK